MGKSGKASALAAYWLLLAMLSGILNVLCCPVLLSPMLVGSWLLRLILDMSCIVSVGALGRALRVPSFLGLHGQLATLVADREI